MTSNGKHTDTAGGRIAACGGDRAADASHSSPQAVSTTGGIPCARAVTTIVFEHPDEATAKALSRELLDRFPFGDGREATAITAIGAQDAMSVLDCLAAILENRELDPFDKIECAQEVVEALTYEKAAAIMREWQLRAPGDPLQAEFSQ